MSVSDALRQVVEALEKLGVSRLAFTGGVAFGAWATPRATEDLDLCGAVPLAAVDKILSRFDGLRVGPERLPHLIRFSLAGWQVDLFVSKTGYDEECLTRAVFTEVLGIPIRVVTPEDLLIHKLLKLRDDKRKLLQDASDVRTLVSMRRGELDWAYVERWTNENLADLLRSSATIDEAELVRRLKEFR